MQADKIQFTASPRTPYQSIDLGILMFRRWWKPLLTSWIGVTLPLFLPLLYLTYTLDSWWPTVALWWLKPLFERVLMHYYSHAVFAEFPSVRQTMRSIFRSFSSQLLLSLTIRRLNPHRAMDLAVTQLEKQSGTKRRKRLNILHASGFGSAASWLIIIGAHVEFIIISALFVTVLFFVPEGYYLDWEALFESPTFNLCGIYIASALMAPIYIGCGFSLYLNRRTALEGWDIELSFRQLHARLTEHSSVSKRPQKRCSPPPKSQTLAAVLLCLLGVSNLLYSQPGRAENGSPTPEQTQQQIQQVLAGEDFHRVETTILPKWPFDSDEEEEEPLWFGDLPDWLKHLPFVMEIILWGGVISLAALFIHRYRDALLVLGAFKPNEKSERPTELFSLDVRKESLPAKPSQEALRLWDRQQYRAALSLLYRASLSHMIHHYEVPLNKGDTEGDCLHLVQKQVPKSQGDYFSDLTQVWLKLAWGHKAPSEQRFIQLCQRWQCQFEEVRAEDGA